MEDYRTSSCPTLLLHPLPRHHHQAKQLLGSQLREMQQSNQSCLRGAQARAAGRDGVGWDLNFVVYFLSVHPLWLPLKNCLGVHVTASNSAGKLALAAGAPRAAEIPAGAWHTESCAQLLNRRVRAKQAECSVGYRGSTTRPVCTMPENTQELPRTDRPDQQVPAYVRTQDTHSNRPMGAHNCSRDHPPEFPAEGTAAASASSLLSSFFPCPSSLPALLLWPL